MRWNDSCPGTWWRFAPWLGDEQVQHVGDDAHGRHGRCDGAMRVMFSVKSALSSAISACVSWLANLSLSATASANCSAMRPDDSAKFLTNCSGFLISWATPADTSPSSASFCWLTIEVLEVEGLGDEIERAAIHGGPDVAHVAISRNDDGLDMGTIFRNLTQQGEAVHHGHVDVGDDHVDAVVFGEDVQGLRAVACEAEAVFAGTGCGASCAA